MSGRLLIPLEDGLNKTLVLGVSLTKKSCACSVRKWHEQDSGSSRVVDGKSSCLLRIKKELLQASSPNLNSTPQASN